MGETTFQTKNDRIGFSIARVGGLAFIAVTLGGLFIWLAGIPLRIEAAEKKIEALEMRSKASEDMLSRIDERTKIILERIGGQR
jgi:hypothetical protein